MTVTTFRTGTIGKGKAVHIIGSTHTVCSREAATSTTVAGDVTCQVCAPHAYLLAVRSPKEESHEEGAAMTVTASQSATKQEERTVKVGEKVYPYRPCTNYLKKHAPHVWHSHVKGADCYCYGEKMDSAEYHKTTGFGSYSGGSWTKKQTDYLTATDEHGRPFRDDFDVDMTVREARAIAFDMHRDDKDKSGEPYILHLAAVEAGVKVLGGPDAVEERIAALFHDAVEDGHTTLKHLKDIGCTEHTVTMIEAVSKRPNEEQGVYLGRIKAAGPGAMRVKVADILHNTRHDRMESVAKAKGEYTRDRLLKKYRPALASLMLELSLIVDEDDQKKLATKPQGTGGWSGTTTGTGTKSTTKSTVGASTYAPYNLSVKSLIIGDWPVTWDAPIAHVNHKDGKSTFTLASGEVKANLPWKSNLGVDIRVSAYSSVQWGPDDGPVPNDAASSVDIDDYARIVEAAKAAKGTSASTASSTKGSDLEAFDFGAFEGGWYGG